eukprot:Cvel_17255.t1-p1 / transcript=Cvel_17255.t1 / gene=Cvel_17255 / organism=Chromera_velia_CCMP2878 / gene_product=Heat shock protein 88, putative / transcript_product=Heat shock protein 88, putative / location=Cvel_scaffold1367:1-1962(-) / protein_length=150 / sequence_SO=supercontig / SO=protein_coding / is_pseudo=false
MSVIGIDVGTSHCVVATIAKNAVQVVRNDLSERLTPSLVGFTDKDRLIGDQALSQIKSNFKNTCRNMKALIGKKFDQATVDQHAPFALSPLVEAEDGSIGFKVTYQGEERIFSASRVTAMLLTKIKQMAEKWLNGPVKDCVISCPGFYDD